MKKLLLLFPAILFAYPYYPEVSLWIGSSASYGSQAIFYNPAILASKANPHYSFSLPSGLLGITNNTLRLSYYNSLMARGAADDTLTIQDKERIMSSMPLGGFTLHTASSLTGLSFAYGGVGLGFRVLGGTYLHSPRDVFKISLYGNEIREDTVIYDFRGFEGEYFAALEARVSAGHGYDLDENNRILGGLSFSLLQSGIFGEPVTYASIERIDGILNSSTRSLSGYDTIQVKFAGGGWGFSLDLGTGYNYRENLIFNFGVDNLFSRMNYTKGAQKGHMYGRLEDLNVVTIIDSIRRDSIWRGDTTFELVEEDFSISLPLLLRFGVAYVHQPTPWKLFFDYEQGFENRVFSSKVPKVSIGGEYPLLTWLPLRLGFTLGGPQGVSWGYGFGLNFRGFYLDFGYTNHRGFFLGGKGESFALYWGFKTPNTGVLKGTIQDSVTGKPLIAQVVIQKGGGEKKILKSDTNGQFSITLSPGNYVIQAEAPNYFPKKAGATVEANKTAYVKLLLSPRYGMLVLKIKDKMTEEPVPAMVTISQEEKQKKMQADSTGILQLKMEEGDYSFLFEHPDYFKTSEIISLKRAQTIVKEIFMVPNKGIVLGKVYNAQTQESLEGNMVIKDSTGKVAKEMVSKKEGGYQVTLLAGTYLFEVKAEGYIPQAAYVFVKGGEKTIKNFPMLKEKMVFTFRNIYFDFDKATIRPESYPVLDSLGQVLKENPTMRVELGGHADERGSRAYNLRLTQARADAVRNYLLQNHRINPARLIAVGYGEDMPVIPNAKNETEHQQNRRVEFKVLGEIK